jgi:hypothetical protein
MLKKVNISTSVNEFDASYDFNIFPNPVRRLLNILLDNKNNDLVEIKITDLWGNDVHVLSSVNNSVKIDVTLLNPGVYFIRMKLNEKNFVKKFIKIAN